MFGRKRKRNMLGLRPETDEEYLTEHEYDVDATLEFVHILREMSGIELRIKTDTHELNKKILQYIDDFYYLDDPGCRKDMTDLIRENLIKMKENDPQAAQTFILVLEFFDALTLSVSLMESSDRETKKAMFSGDRATRSARKEIATKLDKLHDTISSILRAAFLAYGEPIDKFFARHDLMLRRNQITQISKMTGAIRGASRV